MRCGDLERYLEAFLDGRLGRSRTAILRRHLALCAVCQTRVERLRKFELDTRRRFRLTEEASSLWEGLELDLVGSNGAIGGGRLLAAPRLLGPPPDTEAGAAVPPLARRSRRRPPAAARARGGSTTSRLAGALLVAMALGAGYQLLRGEPPARADADAEQAYLDYRRDHVPPALSTGDVDQVAAWLTAELGRPVALPPVPPGYRLVGANRAELGTGASGALIYADLATPDAPPVMLFVEPEHDRAEEPAERPVAGGEGLRQVRWSADDLTFTAIGPLSADRLLEFHHGT